MRPNNPCPEAESNNPAMIWLVDDSPLQAELGRRALCSEYQVVAFSDGAAVLEALATGPAPQLLLVDWHMPQLSGLELCQFVRQTRDAGELPILVLTANAAPDGLVEALRAGANDFVMKPFSEKELQARVSALLRNKALHARLEETERQLRVEAEFRESFIGMLAHDLRQPLNTFVLANQMLEADLTTAPELELLAMQRSAADRMTRMVRELLDFARSRPESGIPVQLREMDFAALAQELLGEMRIGHPARRFELTTDGPCIGRWDRDRLAQLCSNLLGNAVEHGSPDSPISVHLHTESGAVVFSVSNHGEAIPGDALASLFEPFRQGRGAAKNGGIGLGLHIVSEIARAHGGSVAAQSDETATVFTVTLPA